MFGEAHSMRKHPLATILEIATLLFLEAATTVVPAQPPPDAAALTSCTSCQFSDGLQIVHTVPLAPGITSREVETDSGPRQIDMRAGLRVMFAYPETDFYANVKAELLPAANYPQLKQFLLDNFRHLVHGNTLNTALHSPVNGLEIHGLDREMLEGGVLGIYLLFDDQVHLATTIYLLNQEPQNRKFQTMEEYRGLRDRFLSSYTACIRSNQQHQD